MIKLLWVDDNLDQDLAEKRMSLLMEDDIESDFAGDATEAYFLLTDIEKDYDVVLMDLRHPAGPDDIWNEYAEQADRKYGPVLLKMVKENREGIFSHLSKTRYGVFTIETKEENPDLFQPPISLPDQNYKMKTHAYDETDFINFIRALNKS
ncbi:MAG: hypothetical protein H7246_09685 [Phycisphaerae bacterium]|nr:hypothetical protein [Saprospiraceae bacterium]